MARPLTVKAIEAAKPGAARREIPDGGMPGLYLVVQPSGSKGWAVRYRFNGKPRKLTIGGYPAYSLAQARESASASLRQVTEGLDPAQETGDRKRKSDAVEDVLDEYVKRHVKRNNRPSTVKNTKRYIENQIKPEWRGRRIGSIKKRDVVDLLDGIMDAGKPASAARVRAILSKFFNWAVDRDLLDASPVPSKTVKQGKSRDRVLTSEEIQAVWRGCDAIGYPFGPFVQMLLLTAQRRSELAKAEWQEFALSGNDQVWQIPSDRAKNDREHIVPMTAGVISILGECPKLGDFVFSSTGLKPISGFSKFKRALDEKINELRAKEGLEPIAAWRLHDLRRTAASGMASLQTPVHVVEAVLNHKSGAIQGVAAIYNRYDYAEEKRSALEAWSSHVMSLAG